MALGTTRMYASNLALFFEFCLATGRSLRRAALELDRFVHFLAVTPIERRGRGQGQLRSPERVNHILSSVRELYREAVARGLLDGEVLLALFPAERGHRLPAGMVEEQQMTLHERPRHRLRVAKRGRPRTVSLEQFAGLMAACRTWRDRSILALLGRAGLRRGEAVTLRMADVHLAESSREVGCAEPGPHLHVRRREDLDGGAAKSLDPRIVPADELLVFCLDQYLLERAGVSEAAGCDRLLVNLASEYRGRGMTPGPVGALLGSLSRRAGLERGGHSAPAAAQLRERAGGLGRGADPDPGPARPSPDHEHPGVCAAGRGGVARRGRAHLLRGRTRSRAPRGKEPASGER